VRTLKGDARSGWPSIAQNLETAAEVRKLVARGTSISVKFMDDQLAQ
jgi:hypothetical protein